MNDTVLQAPEGKFRVVGVDTFDGTSWVDADLDSREAAIAHADERGVGAVMMKLHVYDDQGKHLYDCGKF